MWSRVRAPREVVIFSELKNFSPMWIIGRKAQMDTEGFEPSTSRMRNGRSSTELSALAEVPRRVSPGTTVLLILLKGGYLAQW